MTAGLAVESLTVRYGGLVAVDEVSLAAPMGRITGLIGPNGAGKTTLFNACSGLVRPSAGTVRLNGRDITDLSLARRPQLGLGRTFQRIELFDSLTVRQNVEIGREGAIAGSMPWRQVFSRRSEQRIVAEAAAAARASSIRSSAVPRGACSSSTSAGTTGSRASGRAHAGASSKAVIAHAPYSTGRPRRAPRACETVPHGRPFLARGWQHSRRW